MTSGPARPPMPMWLRTVLVLLHLAAVAAGLWLGNQTYERWSSSDEPEPLGLVEPAAGPAH